MQERNEQIGGRLAFLRERAGVSRSEMARKVGMGREGYIAWEIGKVRIPLVELPLIAHALGITTTAVLQFLMPENDEQLAEADRLAEEFTRRRMERIEQEAARLPPPPAFAITSRLKAGITRRKKAGNRHGHGDEGGLPPGSFLRAAATG